MIQPPVVEVHMKLEIGSEQRVQRAQQLMQQEGVDLLVGTPSSDLVYLIGYPAHPSERPTLLAVPAAGAPFIVLPALEAPRMRNLDDIAVLSYGETEDPYARLADRLGGSPGRIAISDQAWATVLLHLESTYPRARFEAAGRLLRDLRLRKTSDEIDLLRRGGSIVDQAFDDMARRPFSGRTERELAAELADIVAGLGLDTAGWGPIVASGPNSASAHHMTGDRHVETGDAVILDFGGVLEGYQADTTRTVHVGSPPVEFIKVYELVREAQEAAVLTVGPGVAAEEVDAAARGVIDRGGFGGNFIHRTGHGIGLDTHEEPYIVEGNELVLEPGMTFSVEPGVYMPGQFGVRIEDIVVVTASGAERLNNAERSLRIVE